ncbi:MULTISPECIES: glycosyltransferase family 25 protein [unclassified Crossiella]|uniref:glycosyltransferase family 25 protein n=1 Tax=unclassified Crossiella TaxID=2620835 RepID=UPI0020003F5E|nr:MULTISPECIES: glycosyltransferase family 25 protein [unclassified Crossiella]MCK2237413.1 glycosyltransferase family 25 protein [Crossiella sp. S99.2]MCK2251068.1 glycosyltransferase family 25 protein [Crossiella sp. S99.1]
MTTPDDIRTYVINLPRRRDRREWMERSVPPELRAAYTSDWHGPFDGHDLTIADLDLAGYKLFPWQINSSNPWWSRPLKYGEIACTLAHLACWRDARSGAEPFVLILEDDAILPADFLNQLLTTLGRLAALENFDLLYLGRVPLEADQPTSIPGLVVPGYSHCTFGYLLTRKSLDVLLDADLEHAIVPVDEFLPALYIEHPRTDLRARFPGRFNAVACEPPLVRQRSKNEAGSDTEDSAFVER